MAARIVKIRHDEETRFFVYVLRRPDGAPAYVGKGSGNRLRVQCRKFGLDGDIVARFKNESAAYAHEVKLIAEIMPSLNRHIGGNGNRATRRRKPAWAALMDRIGTRAYGARLLLELTNPCPTKRYFLEKIAHG